MSCHIWHGHGAWNTRPVCVGSVFSKVTCSSCCVPNLQFQTWLRPFGWPMEFENVQARATNARVWRNCLSGVKISKPRICLIIKAFIIYQTFIKANSQVRNSGVPCCAPNMHIVILPKITTYANTFDASSMPKITDYFKINVKCLKMLPHFCKNDSSRQTCSLFSTWIIGGNQRNDLVLLHFLRQP